MKQVITYKDFDIEVGFYGGTSVTVQYCGDDVVFDSVEEAKEFIDSLE